jgi:hypothetical protein
MATCLLLFHSLPIRDLGSILLEAICRGISVLNIFVAGFESSLADRDCGMLQFCGSAVQSRDGEMSSAALGTFC